MNGKFITEALKDLFYPTFKHNLPGFPNTEIRGQQIQLIACFCTVSELRMLFTFVNGCKVIQRRMLSHDTRKSYEMQVSLSTHGVVLAHGHTDSFMCCCPWLLLRYNSRVSSYNRGCVAHKSLQHLLSGPLEKQFADP